MYDFITIGSSLIDTFVHSSEFSIHSEKEGVLLCQSYGDKIEVDSFAVKTGGGASNTAVGFARMGFRVGVVSELGKDVLSSIIENECHEEKVATNFLITERKEQTGGSVILIGEDGGRTVLVHRGASSHLDPQDIPDTALEHAEWIHLSSISGQLDTLRHIFSVVAAGKKRVSWNPGKVEIKLLVDGSIAIQKLRCEVLLVNRQEWATLETVQHPLEKTIPIIAVTDGKNGGRYFLAESGWHEYEPQVVESVDDTGAGDGFAVGFVTALFLGKEAEEAVRWGVFSAQSVVQQVGSKPGLLTRAALEQLV
jgi:sugar/nucleoside kinase (ribokinase family)